MKGINKRKGAAWHRLALLVLPVALAVRALGASVPGAVDIRVQTAGSHLDPFFVAAYFAGYLGNVKGYTVDGRPGARVLAARITGFEDGRDQGYGRFALLSAAGDTLQQWEAPVRAPAFDPPWQRQARPYGNLDSVFAVLPRLEHSIQRTIRVAATTDQEEPEARSYLREQLRVVSRVLARDFGVGLQVDTVRVWQPRYDDVFTIARAANALPERKDAELTLVTSGPPAPLRVGPEREVLGYARVLADVLVSRVMNARVLAHEIAHALGAVHVSEAGCAMQPSLWRPKLAGRFEFLPAIRFCSPNDRIMAAASALPLGGRFVGQQDKIAGLLAAYEKLSAEHGEAIAPYRADFLLSLDRVDEAVSLLEEALERSPGDEGVRAWLVEAYQRAGDHAAAQRLVGESFEWRRNAVEQLSGGRLRLQPKAVLRLSAATVVFGNVSLGREERAKLTLANVGTASLTVSRLSGPEAPFVLYGAPGEGAVLEPGKVVEFEVGFGPGKEGSFSGAFTVFSDAGRSGVLLKGRGVWP